MKESQLRKSLQRFRIVPYFKYSDQIVSWNNLPNNFIITSSLLFITMNDTKVTAFDKLCSSILDINTNIQSVSIINKHGKAIERKTSDDADPQVTGQKIDMFFMQCVLTISMGRDFDEEFGEIGYVHIDRKNLSMFSFPVLDHVVLVTSKAAISPISLAKKISSTINRFKKSQHMDTHTPEESSDSQKIIQLA